MRIFIIFVIFIVSACNENGSEQAAVPASSLLSEVDTPPSVTEVQEENSLTEVQGQTTAGLKGTDDNANGIRDDIDQLIEQKFSYSPEIKRAAEQEARALQHFMEVNTKEEALKAAEQIARATSCTFKILSDPIRDYEKRQALSKELEAWTTNTKERLSKYLESSQLIGGAYFMQPVEPVCD
ncbi:chromosome segregation ATPase [Candidatus Thiomargarita nelsonii]|uniref:Chromosome segregation ATPase n=1 Tax=Candidatus Thiomargarita nelsonii TaxID=1003181 RepID=A0A176RTE0_9GAMM|nr:chromosome segregation ATPase [Candidatus Thiomargarita nelsonii]